MAPQSTTPLYAESDTKFVQLLSVLIVTTTLALVAFALRMYVRLIVLKKAGWDDCTISAAMVFALVVLVFESLALKNGIGTHRMYLSGPSAIEAAKWATLTITPNILATMMARISLSLMLLRIVGWKQPHRAFLVTVIVLTAAIGSLACINTYITCQPMSKIWDHTLEGECNAKMRHAIALTQAIWTISSDWLVALFPALLLRDLRMASKAKMALGIIMGLGFLIGVLVLMKTLKVGALFSRTDPTYDGADLATWSIVEQNVGIVIVNVPAIRPLFSSRGTSGGSGSRYNERSYKMNNMRWHGISKGTRSMIVTLSAREEGDGNGSEFSLVAENQNSGAAEAMDVPPRSYQPSREGWPQDV